MKNTVRQTLLYALVFLAFTSRVVLANETEKCGESAINVNVENFLDSPQKLRLKIVDASEIKIREPGQEASAAQSLDPSTVVSRKAICIVDPDILAKKKTEFMKYCFMQVVKPGSPVKFELFRNVNDPGTKGTQSKVYETRQAYLDRRSPGEKSADVSTPLVAQNPNIYFEQRQESFILKRQDLGDPSPSFRIFVNGDKISVTSVSKSDAGSIDINLQQSSSGLSEAGQLSFDRKSRDVVQKITCLGGNPPRAAKGTTKTSAAAAKK